MGSPGQITIRRTKKTIQNSGRSVTCGSRRFLQSNLSLMSYGLTLTTIYTVVPGFMGNTHTILEDKVVIIFRRGEKLSLAVKFPMASQHRGEMVLFSAFESI